MQVQQERCGTVAVLTPRGALIEEDNAEFVNLLEELLAEANPRFVVNMEKVAYLDSHGLEALRGAALELSSRSMTMKLARMTATAREILDLTELTTDFEIFDDVEDAVRSFL